jgi:hypothetical protein
MSHISIMHYRDKMLFFALRSIAFLSIALFLYKILLFKIIYILNINLFY